MNYTSAAIGVIMCVAVGTWGVSAGKRFSGPEVGAMRGEGDVVVGVERTDSEEGRREEKKSG